MHMRTTVPVTIIGGKKVSIMTVGSTNSFGPSDLDMRPPQMLRGVFVVIQV